jgi:ATP-dependent DNA helicase DinG
MSPSARDLLGPDGPLARALPGYEAREAQLAMADAVERALSGERHLVCEAGTGTGKTLAYLVPAILSGKKVVVSTATKALQEQIVTKDLPLLAQYTGLRVDALLVKGLSNYLCRRRYGEFRASAEALRPGHASAIATIERWVGETESGDLAELVTLEERDVVRLEVASSSDTRVGAGCGYYEECFVTRLKREAERAQLLIVNHHLLFADLALKGDHPGGALPAYEAVVFDEAHQLEDVATDFFGVRVSGARVEALARDAERAFRRAGLGDALFARSENASLSAKVREAGVYFFSWLVRHATGEGGVAVRQPLEPEGWPDDLREAYHRLEASLAALGAFAQAQTKGETVEQIARRALALRADLEAVVERPERQVAWLDTTGRGASVGCSPVDVAGLLKAKLFDVVPSAVLTSATLATGQGFAFFRARTGLEGGAAPVDELALPSPFDYAANALVYIARDLPEANDPAYFARAGERVAELVRASGGGAFVLCTSLRAMRALHAALARAGVGPLFVQGQAPKGALLARFRADGHAVLVATMSFWEGVDVPGQALRLVILDKIPFPVPSDPVVRARGLALEGEGQNPFTAYHVPTAAITLKQGFGRLLRTASDRGVVALLDRRLVTRGYGKALLASLPPAPRTQRLDDVVEFFRVLPGAKPG